MKTYILILILGGAIPKIPNGNLGGSIGMAEAATDPWNHEGRDYWPQQFPTCNGKRQSPININNQDVKIETDVNDLMFERYDAVSAGEIENNGHVLQFNPTTEPSGAADVPRISKGMLENGDTDYTYDFLQAHFHWGSHSGQGSEHRIDDVEYPLELHIVHTNTLQAASPSLDKNDCYQNGGYCSLAVVGILFHVGSEDNTAMQPFVDAALAIGAKATYAEQEAHKVAVTAGGISLKDLIDQVDIDNNGPAYYYYKGSLTTPECNEVVNWFVMENTISISEYQIEAFRTLKYKDGAPMVDNYRHPQPVNNRVVKRVLRDLKQEATA